MSHKKSTARHMLEGTYREAEHGKPRLQFAPASTTAPKYLNRVAKQEWNRVAPALLQQGLLKESDTGVLSAYCVAYAGFRECLALVNKQGHIVLVESTTRTGKTSKPIRNPAVTLMLDYKRSMLASAGKFGFSPYDRERIEGITVPESENNNGDGDPLDISKWKNDPDTAYLFE